MLHSWYLVNFHFALLIQGSQTEGVITIELRNNMESLVLKYNYTTNMQCNIFYTQSVTYSQNLCINT